MKDVLGQIFFSLALILGFTYACILLYTERLKRQTEEKKRRLDREIANHQRKIDEQNPELKKAYADYRKVAADHHDVLTKHGIRTIDDHIGVEVTGDDRSPNGRIPTDH